MNQVFHIGTSAFSNGYWKGIFYPEDLPRTKWFDHYALHFDTYEINSTFYRWPRVKTLQAWHEKTPQNFTFSLKVPRTITHFKRFEDCGEQMETFYGLCRDGLSDKLACVLFQLPGSFVYSKEKLGLIISLMDAGFRNVIEFRHESWWRADVFEELRNNRITFCNVSYPKLPTHLESTTDIGYIRLHGAPRLFYSGYDDTMLENLVKELDKIECWKEVFIYFNNTADVHGITNAIATKRICEGR